MSLFEINLKGQAGVKDLLERFPAQVRGAQRQAVNRAGEFAYASSSRAIRAVLNLSQTYIGSANSGNRLKITQRATDANPVVKIEARQRPVSLARFATQTTIKRGASRKGIEVRVKPGAKKRIGNSFFVRLRKGRTLSQDEFNLGLVLRTKPGQAIKNRNLKAIPFGKHKNLFLLYGPSVDQIFRQVRSDLQPQIIDVLVGEFLRQMERRLRG